MPEIEGLLIDLDGTVYEGKALVPGAADAVERLREGGIPHLFTTNTSRMSRRDVVERLSGLGLEIEPERVLTAPLAAVRWLRREGVSRVQLLLPESTHEDFEEFELTGVEGGPDAVVVGDLGAGFTFERLNAAFRSLRAGARLVAIHRNRFCLPGLLRSRRRGPRAGRGPAGRRRRRSRVGHPGGPGRRAHGHPGGDRQVRSGPGRRGAAGGAAPSPGSVTGGAAFRAGGAPAVSAPGS